MNLDEIAGGGNNYPPFLKQAELKKGAVVVIMSALRENTNPKIKNKYLMDVGLNGTTYTWTPNITSLNTIGGVYGKTTADWVGKQIEFFGMKTMGQGRGYLWNAYEKV